jgi:TPR repeat protein
MKKKEFDRICASAQEGDKVAQYTIGKYYCTANDESSKIGFYWIEKSAIQDYGEAQYELGWCYKLGKGTKKNFKKSIYWLKKSATNEMFCNNEIYYIYKNGEGIKKGKIMK